MTDNLFPVALIMLAAAIPASIALVLRLMPTGQPREVVLREMTLKEKTLELEVRKVSMTELHQKMQLEEHELKMKKAQLELDLRTAELEANGGAPRSRVLARSHLQGGRG